MHSDLRIKHVWYVCPVQDLLAGLRVAPFEKNGKRCYAPQVIHPAIDREHGVQYK